MTDQRSICISIADHAFARLQPERETAAQEKSAGQVPEAEAMGLPVPAKRLEPRKMVRNWWDGLVGAFGGHKEDQNSNKLVVPKPEMEANHDEKKAQDPKPVPDNDPGAHRCIGCR